MVTKARWPETFHGQQTSMPCLCASASQAGPVAHTVPVCVRLISECAHKQRQGPPRATSTDAKVTVSTSRGEWPSPIAMSGPRPSGGQHMRPRSMTHGPARLSVRRAHPELAMSDSEGFPLRHCGPGRRPGPRAQPLCEVLLGDKPLRDAHGYGARRMQMARGKHRFAVALISNQSNSVSRIETRAIASDVTDVGNVDAIGIKGRRSRCRGVGGRTGSRSSSQGLNHGIYHVGGRHRLDGAGGRGPAGAGFRVLRKPPDPAAGGCSGLGAAGAGGGRPAGTPGGPGARGPGSAGAEGRTDEAEGRPGRLGRPWAGGRGRWSAGAQGSSGFRINTTGRIDYDRLHKNHGQPGLVHSLRGQVLPVVLEMLSRSGLHGLFAKIQKWKNTKSFLYIFENGIGLKTKCVVRSQTVAGDMPSRGR